MSIQFSLFLFSWIFLSSLEPLLLEVECKVLLWCLFDFCERPEYMKHLGKQKRLWRTDGDEEDEDEADLLFKSKVSL